MAETPLLNSINSPQELKAFPAEKLDRLAVEIRDRITEVVSHNGGHLSSNLGIVELTIALHRVFNFKKDNLVFDVGHQSYPHKLLTGRQERFHTLRQKNGISGFPNPAESEYDTFISGHASTSLSAATGLAAANRLTKNENKVVALIGDGALGGGMCFEAMNHIGHSGEDVLIVLNDNEMAIGKTVGAFARKLEEFRSSPQTTQLREELRQSFQNIPLLGTSLEWLQERVLNALKNHSGAAAVFEAMGFRYFGPFDGHDIATMENELHNLRKLKGPRVFHVITVKGHGFDAAVEDPESYHSAAPFVVQGTGEIVTRTKGNRTYSGIFADALLSQAKDNEKVIAITAAMTAGTGLKKIAETLPERFFDVGIAEAHAIPFAGALAKKGLKPVVAIYSTFLQRAYDQIFHDVCLQPDCPVVFALDRAGLVGSDGPTHHGIFDIAFLRHLPNIILMAPRDGVELEMMLEFALNQNTPCALRYPRGGPPVNTLPERHAAIETGVSETLREGADGVIMAYGKMVEPALKAAKIAAEKAVELEVINARFAKPLDGAAITRASGKGLIFTLEDHALAGGFGSAVTEFCADNNLGCRVMRKGIPDEFQKAASVHELFEQLGLTPKALAESFVETVTKHKASTHSL